MSIEDFHELLISSDDEAPLLEVLRALTNVEEPEEIADTLRPPIPAVGWGGWY